MQVSSPGVIAVTGLGSYLGRALVDRLLELRQAVQALLELLLYGVESWYQLGDGERLGAGSLRHAVNVTHRVQQTREESFMWT